jgi:hypothetical protein
VLKKVSAVHGLDLKGDIKLGPTVREALRSEHPDLAAGEPQTLSNRPRHCANPQSFAILLLARKHSDHDFTELSAGFVPIDKLHVSLAVVAAAPEQLQPVIRVRLECPAPATARSALMPRCRYSKRSARH